MVTYILLGVLAILAIWLWAIYNSFKTLQVRTKEAIADIDVQSKRRFDLIPNLIETVKGYAKQEQTVLENVTKARSAVATGGDPVQNAANENMLTGALKSLFAVSENYPDLKSNQNFLELQRELADTENKMMAARRFYNSVVRDLNTKIHVVPSNIVAGMFGFKEEKFFEVENAVEREPVQVKF